jgi:nitrite reductase/ring-hydroxylating ferredoxin subunit
MDFADAGPESAIPATGGLRVVVNGRAVALFRDGARIVAVDDVCPHAGAPLSQGICKDGEIVCSWHGFRFDATTGECRLYAGAPSATPRAVKVEGGRVWVGT